MQRGVNLHFKGLGPLCSRQHHSSFYSVHTMVTSVGEETSAPNLFSPQMALLPTDTSTINTDMIILEQFIEKKIQEQFEKQLCSKRGKNSYPENDGGNMLAKTQRLRARERGRGIARERGRGVSRGGLGDGSGGGGAAIGKE